MSTVRKYKAFIENFCKFPKNIQKLITKNADSHLIKLICEICMNISKNNFRAKTNSSLYKKINKNRKIISALADRKKPLLKKVKYIRQKGGFILPLLMSFIGPIVSKILSR